jgi:hypothetical protein
VYNRSAVFPGGVKGIRFGPQGKSQVFFAPQFLCNQESRFSHAHCFCGVYAYFFDYQVSELLDEL